MSGPTSGPMFRGSICIRTDVIFDVLTIVDVTNGYWGVIVGCVLAMRKGFT
jgi:hypothetical protein